MAVTAPSGLRPDANVCFRPCADLATDEVTSNANLDRPGCERPDLSYRAAAIGEVS